MILEITNLVLEAAILYVLIVEYFYDKKMYDKKLYRRIDKKANTVVVDIESGVAVVKHKPKNINVVINTKSNT